MRMPRFVSVQHLKTYPCLGSAAREYKPNRLCFLFALVTFCSALLTNPLLHSPFPLSPHHCTSRPTACLCPTTYHYCCDHSLPRSFILLYEVPHPLSTSDCCKWITSSSSSLNSNHICPLGVVLALSCTCTSFLKYVNNMYQWSSKCLLRRSNSSRDVH